MLTISATLQIAMLRTKCLISPLYWESFKKHIKNKEEDE